MINYSSWAVAGLIIVCIIQAFVIRILWGDLALERSEHENTGQQLVEAVKEGNRWASADAQRKLNEEALQQLASSALARERQAQLDAVEREAERKKATYTAPTEEQKARMVNAETRRRIAGKLNRPL